MEKDFSGFQKYETGQENQGTTEGSNDNINESEGTQGATEETQSNTEGQQNQNQQGSQTDEFIETFNKRYSTQFKADEEIKGLFELPTKVRDFEGKLKDYDSIKKSNDQYKVDLENTQISEASKYLEDPIMQRAWVVKELKAKYPTTDVGVLTNLAMTDLDKISDLDILASEVKMKLPNRSIEAIKSVILDEIGADTSIDPKEWDEKVLTKLEIKAAQAKENIRTLLGGIQLPKVETKEQRDLRLTSEKSKRTELLAPYKAKYSSFDKFKMADLEYTVPGEFKSKLGGVFDSFFEAGVEPTEANIEVANDIRDAIFFKAHEKEIYDVMKKDAESKIRAEYDKKFANTNPLNTTTAGERTEGRQGDDNGTSFSFHGQRSKRI